MAIHFDHTIDLQSQPSKVFAVLDDLTQTPKWLARCVSIEKLTDGPLAAGTQLRYTYREGRRTGVMGGHVVERIPDQKLQFLYEDKMMLARIDFSMQPAAGGTRLTHAIDLTPKTFFCKLMSPLIRKALPKQTIAAMESLRTLVGG